MSDRGLLTAGILFLALTVAAGSLLLVQESPAEASALSRGSGGLFAARRYLEARGCQVAILDKDLDAPVGRAALVLAFPWQSLDVADLRTGVERQLQSGGDVVFAYSGQPFDVSERLVAQNLGLELETRRGPPPRNPWRWRRYASEEWSLKPERALAGELAPIRVAAPRRAPMAPPGATVLARDPEGRPAVFVLKRGRGRGRVVAVPANALSNARIGAPGNVALLEELRQELGGAWAFDEFHHGLRAQLAASRGAPQILLLWLGQVGFVYALLLLAFARRFGPAWSEPIVASGSAATFLVGLGALHQRLGHQTEAARLLLERAKELAPQLTHLDEPFAVEFLELARRVGEAQSRGGRNR